jgi:hypothetical protein
MSKRLIFEYAKGVAVGNGSLTKEIYERLNKGDIQLAVQVLNLRKRELSQGTNTGHVISPSPEVLQTMIESVDEAICELERLDWSKAAEQLQIGEIFQSQSVAVQGSTVFQIIERLLDQLDEQQRAPKPHEHDALYEATQWTMHQNPTEALERVKQACGLPPQPNGIAASSVKMHRDALKEAKENFSHFLKR